jgi:hypothetical protein
MIRALDAGVLHIGPVIVKFGNIHEPAKWEDKPTHFGADIVVTPEEKAVMEVELLPHWEKSVDWFCNERKNTTPKQKSSARKLTISDMFKEEVDREGKETGNFTFRAKANIRDGEPVMASRPPCVLADGTTPYTGLVGRGDKVIVSCRISPWVTGVGQGISLRLLGVQLIEKSAGTGGSGPAFADYSTAHGSDDGEEESDY